MGLPLATPSLRTPKTATRPSTTSGTSSVRRPNNGLIYRPQRSFRSWRPASDPYKPNHNLDAAKQLTDNGFPVTGDLLCATECTHHAPARPDTVEGDGASDSTEGETDPDPAWLETLQEIKRMEDEGQIDKVDYDPFKPVYDWAPKEAVMPYADEVADAFRAELDLRAERRANWPEIEERRRKKHAEIYPSHSDDDTEDPPDT